MPDNTYRGFTDRDHREIVHDLRMRVLSGEDILPEEMFLIIDQIRQGRRTAGAPPSKVKGTAKGARGAKSSSPSLTPIDLDSLMNQEM